MSASGDHPDQQVTGRDVFLGASCLLTEIILSFIIALALTRFLRP